MKILEVNYTDLPGRIYSGYDLHLSLRKYEHEAVQIVLEKYSETESVISLKNNVILYEQLRYMEKKYSMSNLLMPYGIQLLQEKAFIGADIVHYHILHCWMISVLDYPILMNAKPSVWTLHDPWIFTGNCVHPMDCGKWKEGCFSCGRLSEKWLEMHEDNPNKMWKIKEKIFKKINPQIVVSSFFMKKYIEQSPMTSHWNRVAVIPFGIKSESFDPYNHEDIRMQYKITPQSYIIGFRCEHRTLKGCHYIFDALRRIVDRENIVLLTVGDMELPEDIQNRFHHNEWGWINDDSRMRDFFRLCDVFLMPSLAESFGMMALEAMAAEAAVIYFQSTVLDEIIGKTTGAVKVQYRSSEELYQAILYLQSNLEQCRERGKSGKEFVESHYPYDLYVRKHLELYNNVIEDKMEKT